MEELLIATMVWTYLALIFPDELHEDKNLR